MRANLLSEWIRAQGVGFTRGYLTQLVAGLGIPLDTAIDQCGILPIRRVAGHMWEPADDGKPCLLVGAIEDEVLIDLLAVAGRRPADWLLRTRHAALLGADDADEPMTAGQPLEVWSTPVNWLRSGARGVCILDWAAARWRLPAGRPLLAENIDHGQQIERRLTCRPHVMIRRRRRVAA